MRAGEGGREEKKAVRAKMEINKRSDRRRVDLIKRKSLFGWVLVSGKDLTTLFWLLFIL